MSDLRLLIIVLNQEEHLDELLEAFVELDVRGATVIDSVGMGRIIAHDIPVFGGLRSLMAGSRPYNKTILSVVHKDKVLKITSAMEQICGALDKPGTGLLFTVPVDYAKGLPDKSLL